MTLNSVVNPWIFMMFNTHLVDSLKRLFCPSCYEPRHNGGPRGLKRGLLNSFKKQNIPTSDLKRRSISPRFVLFFQKEKLFFVVQTLTILHLIFPNELSSELEH